MAKVANQAGNQMEEPVADQTTGQAGNQMTGQSGGGGPFPQSSGNVSVSHICSHYNM